MGDKVDYLGARAVATKVEDSGGAFLPSVAFGVDKVDYLVAFVAFGVAEELSLQ